MDVPAARGPISAFLRSHLPAEPHPLPSGPAVGGDPLDCDDLHVSLAMCYELHYRGLSGVDDRWEWEPSLLSFRARLERAFTDALCAHVPRSRPRDIPAQLAALVGEDTAPSLSSYMSERATPQEFAEFIVHRSFYQLREADPHTWAIPRLAPDAKAALVMVQTDEYGGGVEARMHSELFRQTMRAFELDTSNGAYADQVPGVTLATMNLMSMFGLHRRWRGAIVGHLAAFEMTSTTPNKRYGDGLRRLGFGPDATEFFDEHVTADAVHEVIAGRDLAGAVARENEAVASDVLFGAGSLLVLEARFARHLLGSWARRRTSLRAPLAIPLAS